MLLQVLPPPYKIDIVRLTKMMIAVNHCHLCNVIYMLIAHSKEEPMENISGALIVIAVLGFIALLFKWVGMGKWAESQRMFETQKQILDFYLVFRNSSF